MPHDVCHETAQPGHGRETWRVTVFMLWHMRPLGPDETDEVGETNDKLCGVFTTKERAEAARRHLVGLEGFRDCPNDFPIDEVKVDEILWEDGFVIVAPGE